jgi:(1->4)-alpha-D-glucan 1-alpha-D-glucosylmutase
MYVTHRALTYRRDNSELFRRGGYLPLEVAGGKKEHACAFAREYNSRSVVVIVPRLICKLTGGVMVAPHGFDVWEGTWVTIPSGTSSRFRNIFTGEIVDTVKQGNSQVLMLGAVFSTFPVALLEGLP